MIKKLSLLFCSLFWAVCSQAATVNLNFQPQVFRIDDPDNILGNVLGLSVGIGDTISAGYRMDTNPAYIYEGPGAPAGSSSYTAETITTYADIGGVSLIASTDMNSNTFIGNNSFSASRGVITDVWRVLSGLTPTILEQPDISIGVIFFDGTTTRLTGDNFFVNRSFDGWDDATLFINGGGNTILRAKYIIDTVPIPSAVWLFGSGLIGLIGFARSKA